MVQVAEKAAWVEQRHRSRVAEIIGLMRNIKDEMSKVQSEDDQEEP